MNGQILSTTKLDNTISAGIFVSTDTDHAQIAIVIDSANNLIVVQLPFLKVIACVSIAFDSPNACILAAAYDRHSELVVLALNTGGLFVVSPKV